jgi:hypothetical protein
MLEKVLKSDGREGVFYILRFPTRWRLYAFPREDFGNLGHEDAWQRYVAGDLAESWSLITSVKAGDLEPWWKGFPRGRVERAGVLDYTVFHGDDIADTGVRPQRVETAFELKRSNVKWSLDPHETQNPEHQAALLRLLPVQ